MTKEELAEEYAKQRFEVQWVGKDLKQDINYARRVSHKEAFLAGFNAGAESRQGEHLHLFEESIRHSFKEREDALKEKLFILVEVLKGMLVRDDWGLSKAQEFAVRDVLQQIGETHE